MLKKQYFPMTLIAIAILSGCNSMPENSSLTEAHSRYNIARSNPQITNLAARELKEAEDSLTKADVALSKGESNSVVNNLAYIAKQKVEIAQETSKRKTAELAVTDAGAKRDQARLEARTAEADTAKQQLAIMQQTTAQQSAQLATASANAERDQTKIAAMKTEVDSAALQVALVGEVADQQAAALADADANTARDKIRLEALKAEADMAKQHAEMAQKNADQNSAALTAASVNAEHDQALIAQQQMQLKELNAKKTARGLVITLGDVLFSTGKAQLKSGATRDIQKLADFLKQYPQQKLLVEGYTDSVGSNSMNQALSERRADAVRAALMDKGIASDRIATHGYGENFPVAGNNTAADRQLNRRVEIVLSDDKGNITPR